MDKPIVTIYADTIISVIMLDRAKCSDLYEALRKLVRKGAGPERNWRLSNFVPTRVSGFKVTIFPADVCLFEETIQAICDRQGIKIRKQAFIAEPGTDSKTKKKK